MRNSCGVIFRCDASQSIGTGHLARCKVLARSLKRRGCRVVFFCRDHPDSLHCEILRDEFECITLSRRTDEGAPSVGLATIVGPAPDGKPEGEAEAKTEADAEEPAAKKAKTDA